MSKVAVADLYLSLDAAACLCPQPGNPPTPKVHIYRLTEDVLSKHVPHCSNVVEELIDKQIGVLVK